MTGPHVLRTKIVPPQPTSRTLARPRLTAALADCLNYRLTLLQAGAGYGKSTALTGLKDLPLPVLWYHVTEEDSDPLVFLLHFCHAARLALPDLTGLPITLLETWDGARGPLPVMDIVDQILNAFSAGTKEAILAVVDDAHMVAQVPEMGLALDRLIGLAPANLHFLLAARPPLKLPSLARWRGRGQVLDLDQSLLLFTIDEITDLFAQRYDYELTHDEAASLSAAIEGWAITLQLIWQSLRSGAVASVEDALNRPADSLDSLFAILAQEVFGQQPADVQEFLRISATLRVITPAACDALRQSQDSAAMLGYLRRQDLFIVDLGEGGLRYHHVFHRFLRQMASPEECQRWHSQAAAYFEGIGDFDAAIHHLLQADLHDSAADLLTTYGERLLATGRLEPLAAALGELPPEALQQRPALLFFLGDLGRLHSRFQEALGWYQSAEGLWRERGQLEGVGRALRGQARVYLDTLNTSRAEELLQQALRLSDGTVDREAQARLYELLAENKLNAGKPQEAERLRQQAHDRLKEGPDESELLFRVLMRTGRLAEAQEKLEERAQAEQQHPVHTPRAHRETQLLLSIIYAFQGQAEKAFAAALEGTRRGTQLNSPYVIAIGHMRQAHSLMLLPGEGRYTQARAQFEKTIEFSRTLAIPRLRVEANWGLCRASGYQGDLSRAQELAHQGIELATQFGDEWIASLLRLTLGASLVLTGRYESAHEWLNLAERGFQECSDPFCLAATRLWMCMGWHRQGDYDRLGQVLPQALAICRQHGYDFLLTRPSLLGPPDEKALVPLLIQARDQGWQAPYAVRLLKAVGLPGIVLHPGYQLRVQALGAFHAWRGDQAVPANGWRREKTRQLYQLLLTFRHAPLDRDQILEHLWPGLEPEVAQRNFKVALSTLLKVLEPDRTPGGESAFIVREGKVYGLRPGADLWLDAEDFLAAVHRAQELMEKDPFQARQALEQALDLFQGDFLPDARYEPWAAEEREHLSVRFLQAADALGELYLQSGQPEEAIRISQRILNQDNCWERAYRILIQAYHRMGDHGQMARTYQRCLKTLMDELEVRPSPETRNLYQQLAGKEL